MDKTFENESYKELTRMYKYMYNEQGLVHMSLSDKDYSYLPSPYETNLTDRQKQDMMIACKNDIHYFLKHVMRVSTKVSRRGVFQILPWQKILLDNIDQLNSIVIMGQNKFSHKTTAVYSYMIYKLIADSSVTAHIFISGDTYRAEDRVRHLISCLPKGFASLINIPNIKSRIKFFDAQMYDISTRPVTNDQNTLVIFDEFDMGDHKMNDIINTNYGCLPTIIINTSVLSYDNTNVQIREDSETISIDQIYENYNSGLRRAIYERNGYFYIDTALVNYMINRHKNLNTKYTREETTMACACNNRIAGKFEKVSVGQSGANGNHFLDVRTVILPKRATKGSAGYDFYAPFSFKLSPGETIKIPTGIKCRMNDGWVLQVYPRSSLGFKYRVQLDNTVGIIDQDYYNNPSNEGHIFIKITNDSKDPSKVLEIRKNDAFAQAIFMQYGIAEDDDSTATREGGIGSTNS